MEDAGGHFEADVTEYRYKPEAVEIDENLEAMMRLVLGDVKEFISLNSQISQEIIFSLMDIDDPGRLADVIVSYMQLKQEEHYSVLRELDVYQRLENVHVILQNEIELAKIENRINAKVQKRINKSQKEYYLREQLQTIKNELGEAEDVDQSVEEYLQKIEKLRRPSDTKEIVVKEAQRPRIPQSWSAGSEHHSHVPGLRHRLALAQRNARKKSTSRRHALILDRSLWF